MPKFNIIKIDPSQNKQEILQMWHDYLPGTPSGRFEWMNDNPAGPPDWFFALDQHSETVSGMISIMPRIFNTRGKRSRVGIVGDFVVKKEYQVFGPSISLLKQVIHRHEQLEYAYLYTLPNPNAAKVCLRGGFSQIAVTERFVKILLPGNRIASFLRNPLKSPAANAINLIYKLVSRETYRNTGLSVQEIENILQLKAEHVAEPDNSEFSKSDQYPDYTRWRYFQNPVSRFRQSVYLGQSSNRNVGKIVYTNTDTKLYVYDFWNSENENLSDTLVQFINDRRKEGYESISIRTIDTTPFSSALKQNGFIPRNEKIPLLYAGNPKTIPKNWNFLDGERNI